MPYIPIPYPVPPQPSDLSIHALVVWYQGQEKAQELWDREQDRLASQYRLALSAKANPDHLPPTILTSRPAIDSRTPSTSSRRTTPTKELGKYPRTPLIVSDSEEDEKPIRERGIVTQPSPACIRADHADSSYSADTEAQPSGFHGRSGLPTTRSRKSLTTGDDVRTSSSSACTQGKGQKRAVTTPEPSDIEDQNQNHQYDAPRVKKCKSTLAAPSAFPVKKRGPRKRSVTGPKGTVRSEAHWVRRHEHPVILR
jgi:hypothetical protein